MLELTCNLYVELHAYLNMLSLVYHMSRVTSFSAVYAILQPYEHTFTYLRLGEVRIFCLSRAAIKVVRSAATCLESE